jgi:signal transduction histidine kinase
MPWRPSEEGLHFYRVPLWILITGITASIIGFVYALSYRNDAVKKEFIHAVTPEIASLKATFAHYAALVPSIQKALETDEAQAALFLEDAASRYPITPLGVYDATQQTWSPFPGAGASVPDDAASESAREAVRIGAPTAWPAQGPPSPSVQAGTILVGMPYRNAEGADKALAVGLDAGALLAPLLAKAQQAGNMDVYVADADPQAQPQILYYYQSPLSILRRTENGALQQKLLEYAWKSAFTYTDSVSFLQKTWNVGFMPNQFYTAAATGYLPWTILCSGLLLTALLGTFSFLLTTQNKRIAGQVKERTLALELQNRHLAHLTACLEAGTREMEQFTYAVSHDLKSPLRTIHTIVQLLEESLGDKLEDEEKNYMRIVKERASKMGNLLEQVLEFARTDNEYAKDAPKVDLHVLLNDVCGLIDIPRNFVVVGDAGLSGLSADRLPLQQVLHNVIDNAIKHHDKDKGVIRVSASPQEDGYISVSVSDDGPGVPEEYSEKIFGMFRTLDNKDYGSGSSSGFGLAMVKKLIARYGGTIKLTPNAPRGLIFSFTWPADIYGGKKGTG